MAGRLSILSLYIMSLYYVTHPHLFLTGLGLKLLPPRTYSEAHQSVLIRRPLYTLPNGIQSATQDVWNSESDQCSWSTLRVSLWRPLALTCPCPC